MSGWIGCLFHDMFFTVREGERTLFCVCCRCFPRVKPCLDVGRLFKRQFTACCFMNEIDEESKRQLSAMSIYMLYFELMVCVTTITVAVLVSWWLTQCASVVDNCVVLNSHLVHGFEFRTPMNGDGYGRYMQKEINGV